MIYDADCAFCRRWVERWRARTGDAVVYRPLQHPGLRGRIKVPRRAARRAVQLLDHGKRHEGADAVFRALARAPRMRTIARLGGLPIVRWVARKVYRLIAGHRSAAGRVDRLLFGSDYPHPDHGAQAIIDQLTGNQAASADELRRAVLLDNPQRLFSTS